MPKPELTVPLLCLEAANFAADESVHPEPSLFGVDNGKTVGTYVESKFQTALLDRYKLVGGNAASGIDLPGLNVDIKVTSIAKRKPQSSCPFRSARQKIFGLGYSLLIFVYQKRDDPATETATLNILHTIFVEASRTGDYQTTTGLRQIIENNGNEDDLIGFMQDKNLPLDEIQAQEIALELLNGPPLLDGYLTISNANQWRLAYGRAIREAGVIDGIVRIT